MHDLKTVLLQHACHAIRRLAAVGPPVTTLCRELGLCEAVCASLGGSKLATIHEQACGAIRNLAFDDIGESAINNSWGSPIS